MPYYDSDHLIFGPGKPVHDACCEASRLDLLNLQSARHLLFILQFMCILLQVPRQTTSHADPRIRMSVRGTPLSSSAAVIRAYKAWTGEVAGHETTKDLFDEYAGVAVRHPNRQADEVYETGGCVGKEASECATPVRKCACP